MSSVEQMARELGQALGRTDEFQALNRATAGMDEDRELVELRNEIEKVESEVLALLQSGKEPEDDVRERYERLVQELQVRPGYQRFVVAQPNFDKLLHRVNDTISAAIQEGSRSRIILP
jgi:cell fate (sporulation/competence/biofilm development) regulator YlbF (YheA/YmcA/DUF963 family)